MRVGTLARKLKIKPSELQEFLAEHHVDLPSGTNTKLTPSQEELAIKSLAPEMLEVLQDEEDGTSESEVIEEQTIEPEKSIEISAQVESGESEGDAGELEEIENDVLINDLASDDKSKGQQQEVDSFPDEEEEIDEIEEPVKTIEDFSEEELAELTESELKALQHDVVRAPKVTLQGLTVKGKIDLPEPKPKVEEEEDKQEEPKPERRERRPKSNKDRRSRRKKDYNPLAAERKRQAQEAEKKKLREAKQRKQQRKKHYEENVRPKSQPTKAKKTKKKKIAELKAQNQPVYSGNVFQRVWQWLNT
jgi:hypothetical protein